MDSSLHSFNKSVLGLPSVPGSVVELVLAIYRRGEMTMFHFVTKHWGTACFHPWGGKGTIPSAYGGGGAVGWWESRFAAGVAREPLPCAALPLHAVCAAFFQTASPGVIDASTSQMRN